MITIEKQNDNITKLYEKIYLSLRKVYRENNGNAICNEICKNFKFEDQEIVNLLLEDLNNDLYFDVKNNESTNELLLGKSSYYGKWNLTILLKKKILSFIINLTLYNDFINDDHEDIVSYLLNEVDSNDSLKNLSNFFKTRNINKPNKLGFKNYFENNKYIFGESGIIIEDSNIFKYFSSDLDKKLNNSKQVIAKSRLELRTLSNNKELLVEKHEKLNDQLVELNSTELELTKQFSIAGNNVKVGNQSKDDVMSIIYKEKENLEKEIENIKLSENLQNIEINYLESIIDYHNSQIFYLEYKVDLIKIILNVINVNNNDIDFFKEYHHQILELMNHINDISKIEKQLNVKINNCIDILNKSKYDDFLLSIFKILNSSLSVQTSEQVYDNLMLIKRSISEYDLELTSNIFNHKTVITMLNNIDEYCTDTNGNKNQFVQFINLNHLNTSLIITILSLINQEKNMGIDIYDQIRKEYFTMDQKYELIINQINSEYLDINDSFYLICNPKNYVNGYEKSKSIFNHKYQLCISTKHKLDTLLNQYRNSVSLERKEIINLKSHISDFIRFNILFDDNTSESSIVISQDPIKMTLDQSVSGTTPVIYSEAVTKFYQDFKDKFIVKEEYSKQIIDIQNKINEFKELQLLGRPGPEGPVGPHGPRGDIGLNGEKGEQGIQGSIGEKGERGVKGERGPSGEVGTRGPQGEKGETGIRGVAGEKGPRGDPFTYDDFTKEQLKSLKGPKGDQGEKGPKGDAFRFKDFSKEELKMLQGPVGERGSKGDRGFKGDKGEKGSTGEKGSRGHTGPQGEQGPPGEIDHNVVAELAIEMDCLKKSVKDFVTTSCIKLSNDIEEKLESKDFKQKLADDISEMVYAKIKDRLLRDMINKSFA